MSGIKKNNRVALDSNIFIYNLEENTRFVPYTNLIFERLLTDTLSAATSIISLVEILSFPKSAAVTRQVTEDFLSTPNLEVFDVGLKIAQKAAEIRRVYGFRLPDAIQLATAVTSKAEVFISNDKKLMRFREVKVLLLSSL